MSLRRRIWEATGHRIGSDRILDRRDLESSANSGHLGDVHLAFVFWNQFDRRQMRETCRRIDVVYRGTSSLIPFELRTQKITSWELPGRMLALAIRREGTTLSVILNNGAMSYENGLQWLESKDRFYYNRAKIYETMGSRDSQDGFSPITLGDGCAYYDRNKHRVQVYTPEELQILTGEKTLRIQEKTPVLRMIS